MAIQWGLLAGLADKFGENYDSARKARLEDLAMQATAEKAKAYLDAASGAQAQPSPLQTTPVVPAGPAAVDQPSAPAPKLPTFARIERGQPSSDIMGLVRSAAASSNLSPDYLSRMVQIESGGDPNARNASGASGLLQFMPGTWKQYAHLGSPFDPSAALEAGADFTAKNRSYLAGKLGRDPTWGETYLAHQQGAGGAAALLTNPNGRAADTVGYKAVLQNLPASQRNRAASLTNKEFADLWTSRFADIDKAGAPAAVAQAASASPTRVASAGSFAPTLSGVEPTDPAERTRALAQGSGYRPIAVPPKPSDTRVDPTQVAQAAPIAPAQVAAPVQATQPGSSLPVPPAVARRLPEAVTRMLQSTNPYAQAKGLELAKKYAAETEWTPTALPNGDLYWTNKQGQSVRAGNFAKPETNIVAPGNVVVRDGKIIFAAPPKPEEEPTLVREYKFARQQGETRPFSEWKVAKGEDDKIASAVAQRQDAAAQLGLKEGSPAYQAYVLTGKMPREDQQPLSASDKKAILEADDAVLSGENVIADLRKAKDLSKTAYEGPLAGTRGYITSLAGAKGGEDTTELDKVVTGSALTQLKAIFGAAPTEGERKILLEIQGSSSQPDAVRQKIYDRAMGLAERRLGMMRDRAAELRGGTFYKPSGGPAAAAAPSAATSRPTAAPDTAAVEAEMRRRGLLK